MAEGCDHSSCEAFEYKLVLHRGFKLISGIHSPEVVDQIHNFEIQDSDVFVITYPKSGTIWLQQILRLMEVKGDVTATNDQLNSECIPWMELIKSEQQFVSAPSPRIHVSHLPYKFMPFGLKQKKGKVIYVARNPKDVLVSYFHFHKYANMLETPKDFDDFFEKFMKGNVFGDCWFEHVKSWCSHKDEMNFLYITYEEMIKDLRSVVEKIASFLGKNLTPQQLNNVVEQSTFKIMKNNPQANYQHIPDILLNHKLGSFMRKGTVGDWKTCFTEAQNERFDKVYQQKMKDVPLTFIWDMSELITP
ncbi:amine sulfotransferase-like [Puntigrus tetrazona]|uniref:amine sulfotransferase-like n=1 Tax=Puntigrus tetrazona TaxID=1606681 RepID=UPI001C892722|nr:amine sulfotransferase-like [Puntigrus tetrazona]